MDATLNINFVPKDEIKVYYGTGAHVDNNASVFFIKSGQKEIDDYVDAVSKPEISDYVETEAKPLVTQIVNEIAEPTVAAYIEGTVKPEIDEYIEDKKPELQVYVTQASEYADNSQESATASAASAAASLMSANNAKSCEENALASKTEAANSAASVLSYADHSKIWAEGSDSQVQSLGGTHSAKIWADQASLASDGKADIDLSNLSSTGLAKFNAKQNTITGAATTIASTNLTGNRALISNASGKVAVSAVTSTELGYLDGVTSSIQTQLNAKAKLASPAFSGTPTAPTQASTNNSTRIATTAFVNNFFNTAGKVTTKCMPNYAASISIASGYTASYDGFVVATITSSWASSTGSGFVYVNGKLVANNTRVNGNTGKEHSNTFMFPVGKGDVVTFNDLVSNVKFYPCKGA